MVRCRSALNYDSDATIDDGTCVIVGCTASVSYRYDPQATVDDGTCSMPHNGCTSLLAINYDSTATSSSNDECIYFIRGCTNSFSSSYNPAATLEDGSCLQAPPHSSYILNFTAVRTGPYDGVQLGAIAFLDIDGRPLSIARSATLVVRVRGGSVPSSSSRISQPSTSSKQVARRLQTASGLMAALQ